MSRPQHPEYSRRMLAAALGVSLGKTHDLPQALFGTGWGNAEKFQRSDNKLRYSRVLSPQGVRQRMQLMRWLLARKERDYQVHNNQIVLLRNAPAAHAERKP